MSYASNFNLNQRLSYLESISGNPVPTTSNLADVLINGNSAGLNDIDMNNQDILQVDNIDLVTINGSAYPPAVSTLADVLLAGNNAGATNIDMNLNSIINAFNIEVTQGPLIDQKNTITKDGFFVQKISTANNYVTLGTTDLTFYNEPTNQPLTTYGKTQMEISNLAGTAAVNVNASTITFSDPLTNGYSQLDINSLDFADASGAVVNTVTQTGMTVTSVIDTHETHIDNTQVHILDTATADEMFIDHNSLLIVQPTTTHQAELIATQLDFQTPQDLISCGHTTYQAGVAGFEAYDLATGNNTVLGVDSFTITDTTLGTNLIKGNSVAITGAGTISASGGLTIPSAVDFTNATAPTCLAIPILSEDLCNKNYVDSQAALTAYQLYFNYSIPYTVPGGATYTELSPLQIPTPATVAWTTNSTAPVLLGSFFNSLVGLNIPASIPAGVWTLLIYANLTSIAGQGREGFFYQLWGTTALGAETLIYGSPTSLLLNTVSPLVGSVSVQGTVPLTSLTGYTGLGIRLYIQSNSATVTTGSIFYQTPTSYSSILTSFAVVQAPNLLGLNNVWTGTNTFNSTLTGNLTGTTTNLAGGLGGQIPYQSAVNTTALLTNGTASQVLTSAGTTLPPTWTTLPTTIATATNLAGGIASQIPYQSSAGVTSFIPNGTLGQVLTSAGTSVPTWGSAPAANLGAVMAVGASASTALNMATFAITNAGAIGATSLTSSGNCLINTLMVGTGANNTLNSNTALGKDALLATTTGASNVAVGLNTLILNTTGNQNTAIGRDVLGTATIATSNNSGLGYRALYGSSLTGSNNTAVGVSSGSATTSGANNTYLGSSADQTTGTGTYSNSTAVGYNSKVTASNQIQMGTSSETTIIPGFISSTNVTTGVQSVNFGVEAGKATSAGVQAIKCVAIGNLAGRNQQQNSTHIGYGAGQTNPGGFGVAIGANAGNISQGGTSAANGACVAVGSQAGYNFQSQYAVAVGQWAGINRQGAGAVAIGFAAGQGDLTTATTVGQGAGAVAIGQYAGEGNSTVAGQGANAVAIGNTAGRTTQGTSAVAIGLNAGTTTQGGSAVAIGNTSGNNNQGASSVSIGGSAGQTNQGANAIAIGSTAGQTTQSGSAIAIGNTAGRTTQGSNAIAIGIQAGTTSQGPYSIAIGAQAGNGTISGQGSNAIAIGNKAGESSQVANSICLNATGVAVNPGAAGFFVSPIRVGASGTTFTPILPAGVLYYNAGEILITGP